MRAIVRAPALVALLALALTLLPALAIPNRHQPRKPSSNEFVKGKICIGTNGKLSAPGNKEHHYRNMKERFTNCTYVDGNLELTWLPESSDLSFAQHIREVTGYVLISHVDVPHVILPELQIIRGRTLFTLPTRGEDFALMVTLSTSRTLELPVLRDILNGNVGIFNNFNLCHVKTINWDEIITGVNASYQYTYNFTSAPRSCPPCDKSCKGGCWGEGPVNCQKFSKVKCSPQCYKGRCYGDQPRDCCHLFCAGGCTGPKQSDCLACQNFYNDGLCTQECPPMQRYNQTTYSWEPNPEGKYAYGATCVRECPEHLLKDNGACVRSCPPNKKAVNSECVFCDGPCPKTCKGVKSVHSGNVDSFKDCTIIDGNLEILEQSFKGFQQFNTDYTFGNRILEMHPEKLEVFSTLREVTGYVNIQGYHEEFNNLSYFRNLEVIGGRQMMDSYFASLYIVKTALESLQLKSLKTINSGAVIIVENKNLCYANSINWNKIKKSKAHSTLLQNNKNSTRCEAEGLVCDVQCSSDGCWGPGPNQCFSCKNYEFNGTCIENCSAISSVYKDDTRTCKSCHKECHSSCTGPGADQCLQCKNVMDGPFCVAECPMTKYKSDNNSCLECHRNCVDGCTGPLNTIRAVGGCNSCERAIINDDVTVDKCLQRDENCPEGYFYEWVIPQETGPLKPLAGKAICRKCHPRCKLCTGYGFHEQFCQECSKFKRGEQCEDECPNDHYVDESTRICEPCHAECRGCVGPDSNECFKCRNLKVFVGGEPSSDNSSLFNCTSSCPAELPNKIFSGENEESMEPYCSATSPRTLQLGNSANLPIILVSILVIVFVILVITGVICHQKLEARKEAVKMTMVLTGCEDNEPLHPSLKPNLAKLRIIKEDELRKGGILGFGAFGKVYKGVWVPEGTDGIKIPVAIKVLKEETGGAAANMSKEFLDEAYIMASVEHPNLLQLLAVCLTQEMMLITQLMPLGCLLDYVRIHKERIGSKALLNWCTQIARGMAYLEEKRLVHRDLAARNVLVQTPKCVKITDFGLAKLLDYNVDQYKADGGKMPIKWLALECIQHRIFTHKSDVWAFGVTIWELMTYGGKPYENISARDVPELIENGLKLPQPTICTLDIYCIMVSCWMLDAESRPTFKDLAATFAEMSQDPGRYLVIQRDKFMRLPPYTQQDEKDLIRSISTSIKTAESMTIGEDYLQQGFPDNMQGMMSGSSSSDHTGAAALDKPCSSNSWQQASTSLNKSLPFDSIKLKNRNRWDQDLATYAQTSYDPSMRHYCNSGLIGSDRSSLKYCDQTNSIPEQTIGETAFNTARAKEAQVGSIKLDLPVDEDDYLMPFPQQHQIAPSYMDLIGESTNNSEAVEFQNYPDFLPVVVNNNKKGLDNPEYLLTSNENINRLGEIPDSVKKDDGAACVSIPINLTGDNPMPPQLTAQKSVEEESISDHEYYNDLQRELQPLRRNETAV